MIIKTKRLILRPWQKEDLEPFARLNADPRVMEYFPSCLNREESDQMVGRMQAKIESRGWGFWAASLIDTDEFIGFIGLNTVEKSFLDAPFVPAVEIGWRLACEYWGRGYAPEGAVACLEYGFETLQLPEIVAFTANVNQRSRKVMEKIGMHYNPDDDFEHSKLPIDNPLSRHVLYRVTRDQMN